MTLNFNFSTNLVFYSWFKNLFLIQNFQSYYKFRSFLSCQIHMTELASAHRPTYLKIIYAPLFGIKFSRSLVWQLNCLGWRYTVNIRLIFIYQINIFIIHSFKCILIIIFNRILSIFRFNVRIYSINIKFFRIWILYKVFRQILNRILQYLFI